MALGWWAYQERKLEDAEGGWEESEFPINPTVFYYVFAVFDYFSHQKSLRDLGCKISQVRIRQKAMGVEEGTKELRSLKWSKAEMHEQTTLAWLFNNQEIAI